MTIDFHSHILPAADHGSSGMTMTREQLAIMRANGVDAVVATPHFEPGKESVSSFLERRAHAASRLCAALTPNMPRIFLGAEVLLCEGMEKMPDLEKLCIEGTRTLLIERPFLPLTETLSQTLYQISCLGYNVVLAHIDRYPIAETCGVLYKNVWAQLNSEALRFPWQRLRYAQFFRDGMVGALGSDIHGAPTNYNHFPKLQKTLKTEFNRVMHESEKLLEGAIPLSADNA